MDVLIRNYEAQDEPELTSIVAALWPDDEDMRGHAYFGPDQDTPTYARTTVATRGQEPVGLASVYQNEWHYHPRDFRLSIAVSPGCQGQGVGAKLHRALMDKLSPRAPIRLRCLTREDHVASTRFFERHGYHVLLRSYSPILSVEAVQLDELGRYRSQLERAGYTFCTLADLCNDPQRDRRVTALCREAYGDTHPHSPPTAPFGAWRDIFLGNGTIEEAFFVAANDGRYAAFSGLRQGQKDATMNSMWDGVSRLDRAIEVPLRLALKACEIAYAREHRIRELHWEVDTTDLAGMRVLSVLPFEWGLAYLMWVRDVGW